MREVTAPAPPRPASHSSPSRLLEDSEEMPYTLADLDAIYREPQQEPQAQPPAPPQAEPPVGQPAHAQPELPQYMPQAQFLQPELPPLPDMEDSRELEHDLNALQETLDKDMMEMECSGSGGIMPPQVIEDESLELQEIMVDNVVASEVTLEDDVFDRDEILDDDPQDTLKDDFD